MNSTGIKTLDLLLLYLITVAVIFITLNVPFIYIAFNLTFLILIFILSIRLKNPNIMVTCLVIAFPVMTESVVFGFDLISISSDESNRLIQNSIIFGYHLVISLISLFLAMYRVQLTKLIFPVNKVHHLFSDDYLPMFSLFGVIITALTLFENYLRNGLGYDYTFFFYAFGISGYFIRTLLCGVLLGLVFNGYKEEYGFKTPTLLKNRHKN